MSDSLSEQRDRAVAILIDAILDTPYDVAPKKKIEAALAAFGLETYAQWVEERFRLKEGGTAQ